MKLSVALCTYNGASFLREQLESLVAQLRRPDELVVCDDCSTDSTLNLLMSFARNAPFPVVFSTNEVTLRSTKNFERTIGRCTGDVIFTCDQDDVWHPDKLARFEAAFADPAVELVASDLDIIDRDGKPLGTSMWASIPFTPAQQYAVERGGGPRLWLKYNTITGAAAAFRARLREVLFPIPDVWVHDAWIAYLAAVVGQVRVLPEPLTHYRSHPAQQIGYQHLSLWRQVRTIRTMDALYFARQAKCFDALAERLDAIRPTLSDDSVIDLVRAKAEFTRARQRMREGWRIARIKPAGRELINGNYSQFSHGWKGFLADVLL